MNYDEFKADFLRQNKILMTTLISVTTILSVIAIFMYLDKKYFLYQGKEIFEERLLNEEVCRQGFKSIAEAKPNPHLVHKGIIEIVEKEAFDLPIEKFLMVKSMAQGTCKIVVKSEGKLLAFNTKLDENLKNPFYYKIIQIDEVAANEVEL
jgi:hypothetical protein